MEKSLKIKESKRKYGNIYNKLNISVQLNKEMIEVLKSKLNNKTSIKNYIEELINKDLLI
jgi:hypothetical protein